MENWKDIDGMEGLYMASSEGRIKSLRSGVIMKPRKNRTGYLRVNISIDGNHKTHALHKLICLAFHTRIEGKEQINHKDGNKENNRPENLEWCNQSENIRHAVDTGLKPKECPWLHIKGSGNWHNKKVLFVNGENVTAFESVEMCAEALNLKSRSVARVCRGERQTYKGLTFKY